MNLLRATVVPALVLTGHGFGAGMAPPPALRDALRARLGRAGCGVDRGSSCGGCVRGGYDGVVVSGGMAG
ncbi:hypothetical protein PJM47_24350 [Mycobacterium kansasii]